MDIKNIYTNTKEKIIDFLLRYLSLHNISYVRVDDEIHFLDKICRFYDSKVNSLDSELEEVFNSLNELEISRKLFIDDRFIVREESVVNKNLIPGYNINKKKLLKMQNRRNNLRLNKRVN